MYRTDKQFMKNPATAASRIYIGNIPKAIIADDLEAKFSKYGKVLGLVINSGFAFIQYDAENEAHAAIRGENNSVMMGRRIMVRQAHAGTNTMGGGQPPKGGGTPMKQDGPPQRGPPPGPGGMDRGPGGMDRGPGGMDRGPGSMDRGPGSMDRGPGGMDRGPGGMDRGPGGMDRGPPEERNLSFEPPPKDVDADMPDDEMDSGPNIRPPPQKFDDNRGRRNMRGGKMGRGGGGFRNRSRDRFEDERPPPRDIRDLRDLPPPHRDNFNERGNRPFYDDFGPPHGGMPPEIAPAPDRNDCEIIVVSRALTEYAEFIESKLKQVGLVVDLLFPNEDVAIGKVLANISSRGCLYAILVMPQNEEHRSLTLNILHGIPQEHRNMPIEDSLILIQRNFEAYMRGEKPPEDPNKISLADRHPVPIQMLFNLLAENRMLTCAQYDRIMKYLQERRDLQYEHEVSEGIVEPPNEPAREKQNELQSRILNILNKSNEPPIPTSITAPDPVVPQQQGRTPLLKDPSVQKALDSILSGDMFKGMAGGP